MSFRECVDERVKQATDELLGKYTRRGKDAVSKRRLQYVPCMAEPIKPG